jgi:hypothetical protein
VGCTFCSAFARKLQGIDLYRLCLKRILMRSICLII